MGFTIEDIMIRYSDQYKIRMLAGKNGWANSISWIHLLEDTTIVRHFWGKELAVTTGLGFPGKQDLLKLIGTLLEHHCSGLIINVGNYLSDIPQEVITYCDENDFPLLTVPWEVYLADMIKDFSLQIFIQGHTDKEVADALILAIEEPDNRERYSKYLQSAFDLDGSFQVIVITSDGLDAMDSLDREKISCRIQMYLENITHNASFFYYASSFVLVANALSEAYVSEVAEGMVMRARKRTPERRFYAGIGSRMMDISNLHLSYDRARAAAELARRQGTALQYFDRSGINRLLYSIKDTALLDEFEQELLSPLCEHDRKHNSNYLETLEQYLKYDGSIQAISEAMYAHRNTIIYRINNIRKMLGSDLKDPEEKLKYQLAFYIHNMKHL